MKLTSRIQNLQKAASTDKSRLRISGVFIRSERAVATNGHILAARKLDSLCEVHDESIVKFNSPKLKGKVGLETYERNDDKLIGQNPNNNAEIVDDQFPNADYILSETLSDCKKANTVRVSLNASLLSQLAESLTGSKKDQSVTLEFDPDSRGSIIVSVEDKHDEAIGIIMPMVLKDKLTPLEKLQDFVVGRDSTAVKEAA